MIKYFEYKNKYLVMKEQIGGVTFNEKAKVHRTLTHKEYDRKADIPHNKPYIPHGSTITSFNNSNSEAPKSYVVIPPKKEKNEQIPNTGKSKWM